MGGVEQGGGASEGASDEERAEAEQFNRMIGEGKLTSAEMAQVEKDKSPEEVEAEKEAMEKVVDIDQKGTAFSIIIDTARPKDERIIDHLGKILKNGLLGRVRGEAVGGQNEYVASLKHGHNPLVHFNIVGRTQDCKEFKGFRPREIALSYWVNDYYKESEQLVLIFDLSFFHETEPGYHFDEGEEFKIKKWSFRSNDDAVKREYKRAQKELNVTSIGDKRLGEFNSRYFDSSGLPLPSSEVGFILYPRVPTKQFKGLVYNPSNDTSKEVQDKFVESTVVLMRDTFQKDPSLTLPIYDIQGNLLWPRKMTYEEVKQFVAEREAKEKVKEEK